MAAKHLEFLSSRGKKIVERQTLEKSTQKTPDKRNDEQKMLMKYCDKCKTYTLKDVCANCNCASRSAHPARFTPQDNFSKYRVALKRKYNLLPSQQPQEEL